MRIEAEMEDTRYEERRERNMAEDGNGHGQLRPNSKEGVYEARDCLTFVRRLCSHSAWIGVMDRRSPSTPRENPLCISNVDAGDGTTSGAVTGIASVLTN